MAKSGRRKKLSRGNGANNLFPMISHLPQGQADGQRRVRLFGKGKRLRGFRRNAPLFPRQNRRTDKKIDKRLSPLLRIL